MSNMNARALASELDALPVVVDLSVLGKPAPRRIVVETKLGTVRLYFARREEGERGCYLATGTLETLRGWSTEMESWQLNLVDEPGNPWWLISSLDPASAEQGARSMSIIRWMLEEHREVGFGVRDPQTGELMKGWLDAEATAPRLRVV